jgi:gamma-glutamylcyclotransferase (GGCT)/AIG2-like uncharacterized protein YtfP
MLIFAYGSNMNLNRLTKRIPSAVKVSNASLSGYKLVCNKVSKKDDSAKANIIQTDNLADLVWGVLFTIDNDQKPLLDKTEGLGKGYNEDTLIFFDETNNSYTAQIYIADSKAIDDNLFPYDWYKEFIVSGAIQNKLPFEYIAKLKSITCVRDHDEERRTKNYDILSGK